MIIEGLDELRTILGRLTDPENVQSVARTAVSAGLKVIRNAGVAASPGRVKLEWGHQVIDAGNGATGIVGLGVGGYRANVARPHGKYLEAKGPYAGFASNAINGAVPRAHAAMIRAAKWRVKKLMEDTNG